MPTPSLVQLQRALAIAEQIQQLEDELASLLDGRTQHATTPSKPPQLAPTARTGGRRTFSAESRAKMAAAQKARWAKKNGTNTATTSSRNGRKKRVLSPEGRARIVAALKARHAAKRAAAE